MIQIIIDGNDSQGNPVHEIFADDELEEAIEFLAQLKDQEDNMQ